MSQDLDERRAPGFRGSATAGGVVIRLESEGSPTTTATRWGRELQHQLAIASALPLQRGSDLAWRVDPHALPTREAPASSKKRATPTFA